jgi:hypothetical protein
MLTLPVHQLSVPSQLCHLECLNSKTLTSFPQADDLILPSPKLYWDLKALPTFDFFLGCLIEQRDQLLFLFGSSFEAPKGDLSK